MLRASTGLSTRVHVSNAWLSLTATESILDQRRCSTIKAESRPGYQSSVAEAIQCCSQLSCFCQRAAAAVSRFAHCLWNNAEQERKYGGVVVNMEGETQRSNKSNKEGAMLCHNLLSIVCRWPSFASPV